MSRWQWPARSSCLAFSILCLLIGPARGDEKDPAPLPHGQKQPPGDPLSPADAIRKMTVPTGFTVELVASEPDIVNPVAMTFDERGRIWITESLEYPRESAGPGRDRIKVLEDTDGDGKADKFTVFAEGLNIPSGIAVGHGGVWVANSPDILFLRDTDGDGKADQREVVLSGFGRDDTHELPNSLSWGPDGWLYGWNGVFNQSHVKYRGKTFDFTCAIFRFHPRTREFEIFCEGTSNPWGITWDQEGSAFASACVIDHLWHLTENGYYHRQGGPYPPFTWKIESIVDHKHQQAAYCGIHYYDSDAYPAAYRQKLFMGNIHGNCINVDGLQRQGSTYRATAEPDFLTAHDAWFMPVAQKTGPDGSLYILDWYDRYHCYQDANRDPEGIDRLKGRLYRVRYEKTPRRAGFDLSKQSDDALIELLGSSNGFDRETARRLLAERDASSSSARLQSIVLDSKVSRRTRMNALWSLISRTSLDPEFHRNLLADSDPGLRAWGVRAAGNQRSVDPLIRERVVALARDASPDVQLQLAIAARKLVGIKPISLLTEIVSRCGQDPLIPHIVWQNLLPLLKEGDAEFLARLDDPGLKPGPGLLEIVPRAMEFNLRGPTPDAKRIAGLLRRLIVHGQKETTRHALEVLTSQFRERGQEGHGKTELRKELGKVLDEALSAEPTSPLRRESFILLAYCGQPRGIAEVPKIFEEETAGDDLRLSALEALLAVDKPETVLKRVRSILGDPKHSGSPEFRGRVVSALGAIESPEVASLIVDLYSQLDAEVKPRAIELFTQRVPWCFTLMDAIGKGTIDPNLLNPNQIRKMLASHDAELAKLVKARWGTVREERNPRREEVIGEIRELLKTTPGDPVAGMQVFNKVCAQCHKLHGEGQDVGPEITLNGRGSYEQLLSNVFDPSLVIGAAYQATIVATTDGRVLSGLLVERSPDRLVLKMQGGKRETIPGNQVDEVKISALSLMPEDLEKQLKPQELADLFSFLTLDKTPKDPTARRLPGAEEIAPRRATR
ncbi:MAG: c-type cytochrome [Isosphaeraceae bacterium]